MEGVCDKKAFATKAQAQQRLEEIWKNGDEREKTPRRSYLCDRCGYYHLTSMTVREKKAAEKLAEFKDRLRAIAMGENIAEFYAGRHNWDY